MPKTPMSKQEMENVRALILDTALHIIIEEGFLNLSLRKIASRIGVTATTIYNYYKNKDEINLMIRIRGFEKLYDMLKKYSKGSANVERKLKAMIRGYLEFGRTYPSYYDIMFNLHTPKYLDYVGTEIEPLARIEKDNALNCLDLFIEPIRTYLSPRGKKRDHFIWSQIQILVRSARLGHLDKQSSIS